MHVSRTYVDQVALALSLADSVTARRRRVAALATLRERRRVSGGGLRLGRLKRFFRSR